MAAGVPITHTPQWALYQQAVVDVELPGGPVRVTPAPPGVAVGRFPVPHGETIHVVTAHNPRGTHASRQHNHRAHQRLLGLLRQRGLAWWPAVGGDPDGRHTEVSVAIVGLSDDEARALGREFGQDAVFAWSAPAWRLLACFGAGEALTLGWRAAEGLSGSLPAGALSGCAEFPPGC
ncbi:DUF3293 domain-containing protein [Streptomyces olivaceoviridis]|uniref:DUF3293 domain-containing protein n=1 Tax=Streptomyces olivaceoviridis TaxID=1921 RepID=UPI0037B852F3